MGWSRSTDDHEDAGDSVEFVESRTVYVAIAGEEDIEYSGLGFFSRARERDDSTPSIQREYLEEFMNQIPPEHREDLLFDKSRRAFSSRGSSVATLHVVPALSGSLCYVLSVNGRGPIGAGCDRTMTASVKVHVASLSPEEYLIYGFARNDVEQVEFLHADRALVLKPEQGAFFLEMTGRNIAEARDLRVTYADGTTRTLPWQTIPRR